MRVPVLRPLNSAILGLSIAIAVAPAHSTIYNISATDPAGTLFSPVAGKTYLIKFIGIAEGGLYDAASVQLGCPAACVTTFSNAFSRQEAVFNPNDYFVETYTKQQGYATAAQSLSAYKAGDNIFQIETHFVNGAGTMTNLGPVPNPFIIKVGPDPQLTRLLVMDTDSNFANNSGGVSLSIEELAAVPEPASWAMMIGGLGLLGCAVRGRRASLACATRSVPARKRM